MLNYRHPGHGAWEGGLRPAAPDSTSPDAGAIAGDRRMSSKSHIYTCFYSKNCSDLIPVQCFFDFFIPLSSKTPSFESFFGRWPARNALKTRCFSREGYQKVEKHHAIAPIAKTPRKVPGRENIDCENTMKMKKRAFCARVAKVKF